MLAKHSPLFGPSPARSSHSQPIQPQLLRMQDVARLVNLNARTLRRMVSAGRFPPPDKSIGAKIRLWKRHTVMDWIEDNSGGHAQ